MRTVVTPASPATRLRAFLAAYAAAPSDADVEIRIGTTASGEPAVAIDLCGATHGFTAREAGIVADAAEAALNAHPNHPDALTLPNLILCLRHGAAEAEKAAPPKGPK